MNDTARNRILERLRNAPRQEAARPDVPASAATDPDRNARIARLKSLMEAMRTEVHVLPAAEWIPRLQGVLQTRAIKTLLYAPETDLGAALAEAWQQDAAGLPELVAYADPVESFKERIFAVEAAVTTAAGAVADTGALILQPTPAEPRLMSLVPPVHIAVLTADAMIHSSLSDAIQAGRWSAGMPTNLLLISGPSKTADIELTLAFGVHGPKELVVLILE
ncbi:MAG: lactate utilization protein [Desulfobacterales bacterium]|jgi:L-lactate dehydrogenase complex protein LldG|nr:lactate utilization protein [Desulfobacterales bacterium]